MLQSRFHFVTFICIPRTGGSYLTAELYRALGTAPEGVPSGVAHDSFPEAGPVLGEETEHVLTVRHPVAACVSTFDKSGGLPADGRFRVRSNIEEWCRRDLLHSGCCAEQLERMDYFDAYLRYWEHYYLSLAMTGLSASHNLKVVAFSKSALQSTAQSFHNRYGSGIQALEFHSSDKARRLHPEWCERAQPAIDRVATAWRLAGISFPVQEISCCS